MIPIPGILITILTFPGFIMSTVAAKFWCDVLGVQVYEAHYFKGTITHEKIESPARAVLVASAPFTVNTFLCAVLCFPIAFSFLLGAFDDLSPIISFVLAWVGISIGMHALPSKNAIQSYAEQIPGDQRRGLGYLIFAFLAALFTLTDFGKRFWVDLIYAGAVAVAAPFATTYVYTAL
jgi:hypothetical protein